MKRAELWIFTAAFLVAFVSFLPRSFTEPAAGTSPETKSEPKPGVESQRITNPENQMSFTIKRYHSEKEHFPDGIWVHKKITLSPDNKDFDDIVLENIREDEFHVVAEFVEILSKE